MFTLFLLASVIIIAVGNFLFTKWFIRFARFRRITDIPSERSSHANPTPKGGGIGFACITVLSLAVYLIASNLVESTGLTVFLLILLVSASLGWFDDRYDLSKRLRFGIQLLAALGVIYFISGFHFVYIPYFGLSDLGMLGSVIALFWITGTANIYNFMDGIDGMATVQAISTALGWIVFSLLWGLPELLTINLFILTSVSVFLHFNWSPAKIFMGDVGSLFLGFAFAIMPFVAAYLSPSLEAGETVWLAGLLLWPFLFDGVYTIFRRLSREENIFKAHRSHLYQRLNIAGWSHKRISILYFIFSVLCISIALIFHNANDLGRILLLSILVSLSIYFIVYVKSVERSSNKILSE